MMLPTQQWVCSPYTHSLTTLARFSRILTTTTHAYERTYTHASGLSYKAWPQKSEENKAQA